jgi:hypothetical protein
MIFAFAERGVAGAGAGTIALAVVFAIALLTAAVFAIAGDGAIGVAFTSVGVLAAAA